MYYSPRFTISGNGADGGKLIPYLMYDKLSDPAAQAALPARDAKTKVPWPRAPCKVRHSDGGLYCCVGCREWVDSTAAAGEPGGGFTGAAFLLDPTEGTDLLVLSGIYVDGHTQGVEDKDGHLRDPNLNSRAGGTGAVWALGRTGRDQWAPVVPVADDTALGDNGLTGAAHAYTHTS